jgi:hypothetical protein
LAVCWWINSFRQSNTKPVIQHKKMYRMCIMKMCSMIVSICYAQKIKYVINTFMAVIWKMCIILLSSSLIGFALFNSLLCPPSVPHPRLWHHLRSRLIIRGFPRQAFPLTAILHSSTDWHIFAQFSHSATDNFWQSMLQSTGNCMRIGILLYTNWWINELIKYGNFINLKK